MCFFPSADFEGENSATQSVVLSENGGKGFVKLGCNKTAQKKQSVGNKMWKQEDHGMSTISDAILQNVDKHTLMETKLLPH